MVGGRTPLGAALGLVPSRVATAPAWCGLVDPVARVVMRGVRTRGTAGNDRREWYGATSVVAVTAISGAWRGTDLGALAPVDPPCRFGFSSTPEAALGDERGDDDRAGRLTVTARAPIWREPGMAPLALMTCAGFSGYALLLTVAPLWVVEGGATTAGSGLVNGVLLLFTVLTQLLVPRALRSFGWGPVLTVGLALLGLPGVLMALSSELAVVLALSAVRGVGFGVLTVTGSAAVAALVRRRAARGGDRCLRARRRRAEPGPAPRRTVDRRERRILGGLRDERADRGRHPGRPQARVGAPSRRARPAPRRDLLAAIPRTRSPPPTDSWSARCSCCSPSLSRAGR